jgi:hypothetical protein
VLGSVRLRGHADANFPLARLGAFRTELHACCTRRADALVDLADALLCAPTVPRWPTSASSQPTGAAGGSAYGALASGRIDTVAARPAGSAQLLLVSVGGRPRPGRQLLTTLATAVTRNSCPVSISRTAKV